MKVRVNGHFDSAHRLPSHKGKCSRLHGHRYEYEIEVESDVISEEGMLLDFGDLKGFETEYDHKTILSENDVLVKKIPRKQLVVVANEPTVEFLSQLIMGFVIEKMKDRGVPGRIRVKLWETPKSMAEVTGEVAPVEVSK